MKLNIQLFADNEVVFSVGLETKGFDRQIADLEYKLEELVDEYEKISGQDYFANTEEGKAKLAGLASQIEKTKNRIIELREKQEDLKNVDTGSTFQNIGNSIENIISKIGRWGLAIIGVRSAYSAIRSAISSVLSSNERLAGQVSVMRTALANALLPVVQQIIKFIARIMQMIDYVYSVITNGKHLFDFAKAFKDAKKSADGTAKAAAKTTKEIQKQLAGFDEMNILSKNTPVSGGAGGGGGAGGSLNFENPFEKFTPPEWLKSFANLLSNLYHNIIEPIGDWISKHPDVFAGLVTAGTIAKITGLLGTSGVAGAGATGLLGILSTLGLLVADYWLIKVAYEGVEEAIPLIDDVKDGYESLKQMVDKDTESFKKNTDEFVANAKAGKNTEKQNKTLADGLLRNIHNSEVLSDDLKKQKEETGFLDGAIMMFNGTLGKMNHTIDTLNEEQKDNILKLIDMAKQGLLTEDQFKALTDVLNNHQDVLTDMNGEIKTGRHDYGDYTSAINKLTQEYNNAKKSAEENTKKTKDLNTELGKIPKTETTTIKLNGDTKNARKSVTDFLSDMGKIGLDGSLNLKTSVNSAINIMKNRKGAIINMPGRGIPLNVGGEAGQEGVIPLTDSQQMALLGEAIGKYITINAQITNTMNGRVISRELQKIQQENSFASNR